MSFDRFLQVALSVLLVTLSASFHEYAHALAAHLLGDDTAKEQGRLTPNPLAHIDPFGSLVLPILMALMDGPVFAFAKPVPYNPNRLRNPGRDDALVALAGPLANLVQALVGTVLLRTVGNAFLHMTGRAAFWGYLVFYLYVYVNLSLMFFNLIPLPPLDGSKLITPFLKGEALESYYRIQSYALPILFIVLYLAPAVLGFDPIGAYMQLTAGNLMDFLLRFGT